MCLWRISWYPSNRVHVLLSILTLFWILWCFTQCLWRMCKYRDCLLDNGYLNLFMKNHGWGDELAVVSKKINGIVIKLTIGRPVSRSDYTRYLQIIVRWRHNSAFSYHTRVMQIRVGLPFLELSEINVCYLTDILLPGKVPFWSCASLEYKKKLLKGLYMYITYS